MKTVPPSGPVDALNEYVRVPLHDGEAIGKPTRRNSKCTPPRLIRYISQEGIGESSDSVRYHVIYGAEVYDEVGSLRRKLMSTNEIQNPSGKATCLEFVSGEAERYPVATVV
jgi:hypothetical protein